MINNRHILTAILVLIILVADGGLFSIADAALVAILLSVMFRQFAVYILILLGTLQDTPGLAGAWWYVSFVCVGCVVIVHSLFTFRQSDRQKWSTEFTMMFVGVCLAAYGVIMSVFAQKWMGIDQSSVRPFPVVGGLIAFNIVCAYHSFRLLYHEAQGALMLRVPLAIMLAHIAFAAFIQAFIAPSFLSSAVSSSAFEGASQLTTVTSLGFARVTGTYATPNGFALVSVLLLLFWLSSYGRGRVPLVFTTFFIVAVIVASLLSLSKAMLAFSLLCSAILLLTVGLRGVISRSLAACLVVLGVLLLSDIVFSQAVLESFRFDALDWDVDTYRNIAWRAVVNDFSVENWLLGTGLAHWPVFFEEAVGFRLSDPHTWIFSYAGTFGILGVLFFAYVLWRLISTYRTQAAPGKALLLCLIMLLLVKDAVSIPYLLGNTPLTWFIWVLLFAICADDATTKRQGTHRQRSRQSRVLEGARR